MRTNSRDNRKILQQGDVVKSPEREYIIDRCLGKGSNAIVYYGFYKDYSLKDQKHWILIKELFPWDGNDEIWRDQDGNIVVNPSAEEFFRNHKNSFDNANTFQTNLINDKPELVKSIDYNIQSFQDKGTWYSIQVYSGGKSVLEELEEGADLTLDRCMKWMKELLKILKVFHQAGYLHLDISLDNILLTGKGQDEKITLIDYNSIISLEEIQGDGDIILSAKTEYAAPEVLRARRNKIGPGTDLYSLTAVFFHFLFNRGRTIIERKNRFKLPDISESVCLKGQNPIVLDMVSIILTKGFSSNTSFRYQNIDQMIRDFDELENRMKCFGITQWALWQKGKEHVENIVRRNTAFRYIMDSEEIYPMKAQRVSYEEDQNKDQNKEIELLDPSFFKEMTGAKPVLLLGSGGMGKTTTLLRLAYNRQKFYTDQSTAIIYISLFDWKDGDKTYIQDKILNHLDFSHSLLENARKELRKLLSEALHTKQADIPRLVLCLDGLNEASGDVSPLLNEIRELCALSGVKVILTSRSEIAGDEFEKWMLSRLEWGEVRKVLEKYRIPDPENMEIMELLQVPMMLSMYIDALDGKKVLKLDSREELLGKYLSVLAEKEARNDLNSGITDDGKVNDLQDSRAFIGAQVAIKYVLPEIAAQIYKKKQALTEKELFQCVKECYKNLNNRAFTSVFENWIGHVKDLKLGTENADEWYGKIVQDILWKKLGLLTKDEEEHYRIVHQIIEEYMEQKSKEFHVAFDIEKRKLRNKKGLVAASIAFVILLGFVAMLIQLTQKQKEVILSDIEMRIQNSQISLENGMGANAISNALSALSDEKDMGKVEANAINALAESAYVYQEPGYHSFAKIQVKDDIEDAVVSSDGEYLILLDERQNLRCYQTSSGEELWTKRTEYAGVNNIKFIENQNAVLVIEYEKLYLFSLKNGEEIWVLQARDVLDDESAEFSYSNTDYCLRPTVSDDGKKLGFTLEKDGKLSYWIYNLETYKCICTVADRQIVSSTNKNIDYLYDVYSSFSNDGQHLETLVYIEEYLKDKQSVRYDLTENYYVLDCVECETGKAEKTNLDNDQMVEVYEDEKMLIKQLSISETELFYVVENLENDAHPMDSFGLSFSDAPENSIGYCGGMLLYFEYTGSNYIFATNERIQSYTPSGNGYSAWLDNALYCQDDGDKVSVFLYDGSVEIYEKKDLSCLSAQSGKVLNITLETVSGNKDARAVCAIDSNSEQNVYVIKQMGDAQYKEVAFEEKGSDTDPEMTGLKGFFEYVKNGAEVKQQIITEFDGTPKIPGYAFEIGENGIAVALCNDGTIGISEDIVPVTHYMVFDSSDDTWERIDNPADSTEVINSPKLAVGQKKKIFAIFDMDNNLYLYDLDDDSQNKTFPLDIDYSSIDDMEFMLDDQFLLAVSSGYDNTSTLYVINCKNGEVILTDSVDTNNYGDHIEVIYNDDNNRVFVRTVTIDDYLDHYQNYCVTEYKCGCCIDTSSWKLLYHIPYLISADEDSIEVDAQKDGVKLVYPNYTTDELIELGEKEIQTK